MDTRDWMFDDWENGWELRSPAEFRLTLEKIPKTVTILGLRDIRASFFEQKLRLWGTNKREIVNLLITSGKNIWFMERAPNCDTIFNLKMFQKNQQEQTKQIKQTFFHPTLTTFPEPLIDIIFDYYTETESSSLIEPMGNYTCNYNL